MAGRALLERRDADLRLGTARRLLERQLEVVAKVGAAEHAGAPPAATLPEDLAEDVAERIGEAAEAFGARSTPTPAESRGRVDARVAELVVRRALLRVGEDLVGFLRLLELVLVTGTLVVRIAVRMVLHRELPVGLLQVLVGGIAIEPQHRVVVALVRHRIVDSPSSLQLPRRIGGPSLKRKRPD